MYDYERTTLEHYKAVAYEVSKMVDAGFYAEEFGKVYNSLISKKNRLYAQLEEMRRDLEEQPLIHDYISSMNEGEVKNILDSMHYNLGVRSTLKESFDYINRNIRDTERELVNINEEAWNDFLAKIFRSEYLYYKANEYRKDKFMNGALKWVFDIEFNADNIIEAKDDLFKALKEYAGKQELWSFGYNQNYTFKNTMEKYGKIDGNEFYTIPGGDLWRTAWEGGKTLNIDKTVYYLGRLHALLSINREPSVAKELIERKAKELEELDRANKRLSIEFMGAEIKFYKTKSTTIKLPKNVLEHIENYYKK